ncbi:MAG: protein-L-isoaspartate O-methyltransferase [Woeseia sp.]
MNIDYARRQMVEQQVRTWDVFDGAVLDLMAELPREDFVPAGFEELAFAETAIPLPHGQFMLPPTVEGRLLQALELRAMDTVLEIGTGSGFLTACLGRLAAAVTSVDIFAGFTDAAAPRLKAVGIENVTLINLDAMRELPSGPFDVIAVGGSLPRFDNRLFELLNPGGRMFVIVGSSPVMEAQLVVRDAENKPQVTSLFETNVPALCNAPVPSAFVF